MVVFLEESMGGALSRAWVAVMGGFGTPPPMAGWLAGAPLENSQNTWCTTVPPLLSRGMGMGMGLQVWGGVQPTFKNTLTSYSKLPCPNTKHRITA